MEIRKLKESEYPAALELAWRVFLEFEAPDYSREGVETFRKVLDDRDYRKEICVYGAFDGAVLVGMLATRQNGVHITLFFVDGKYHRRGIDDHRGQRQPEILFKRGSHLGGYRADGYSIDVVEHRELRHLPVAHQLCENKQRRHRQKRRQNDLQYIQEKITSPIFYPT